MISGDPRHSEHRPVIVDVIPKLEAKWLEEEDCWERVMKA